MERYEEYEEEIDHLYEKYVVIRSRCKQLLEGKGGIMELKQTISDKEKEIERLKEKCDKQAMILRRLTPEQHPDTLFITGIGGEKDMNNMPEKLFVCPSYGADFSYVYERTDKTFGPEW